MRKVLRFMADRGFRQRVCIAFLAGTSLLCTLMSAVSAGGPGDAYAHLPVTTNLPGAQNEFDAGLTMMYAFNPEEATFHFQQAARADPGLAMAYWGIALAAGPNVNTEYDLQRAAIGRDATAQAQALDRQATPRERALIVALAKRYDVAGTAQILGAETEYAQAMADVSRRFPDDLNVKTLYAESLMDLTPLDYWQRDGAPNRYTRKIISLLDAVLERDSDQLGANHYLIHVYEYSVTPQAALESARRLSRMRFAPGAEHLAHMPAHIFTRVGDYDDAIAASLAAATMFRAYLGHEHSDFHNAYFHHDLQVLNYAYMMSGQWTKARDTATEIADQVQDSGAAVETYIRFHRWHELLALPPPAQPGFRWRFAQGMAAAATGDLDSARATTDWIESLHDTDPRTGIAHDLLAASVASAERRDIAAIAALRHAVDVEDHLRVKEPPAWFYPIRETLGGRLALAHRDAEAERVFTEDLRRNPQNPRALFGLAEVLRAVDPKRASEARRAFTRAWHHADTRLTLADL